MLHGPCSTEYLPLTLTLSLREREQQASDWCLANGRWAIPGMRVIERRWTILPLPMGEGWGEGEPRSAQGSSFLGTLGFGTESRWDSLLIRLGMRARGRQGRFKRL